MSDMLMIIDACAQLDFERLTKHRVPGAIPFLSKYRLIDQALSAANNADITNVAVFTDRSYRSLQDHIGSGERYDLARRMDGIFLLPPKSTNPVNESFLSFQRMSEHMEFFNRSRQTYVVIVPATIVMIPDLEEMLKAHIESGKDITEIVDKSGKRLYSFILSKDSLMKYIESYNTISYRNIAEVYDYSKLETKNVYQYDDYAWFITNVREYYDTSFELLNKDDELLLISKMSKIKTKEQLDSSTYYGMDAEVSDSLIANGSMIYGNVEHSIISRRCKIGKGAIVKNSIILNNTEIEEGAYVEYAVLDKETTVKKNAVVTGTKENLFISEKKQIVYSSTLPKVAIITVELSPYVKRGGLADMVGSLSRDLAKLGAEVSVFLPLFKEIKEKRSDELIDAGTISMNISNTEYRFRVYKKEIESLTYYFLDIYPYFDRDEVYGYEDDPYRFTSLVYGAFEYLNKNEKDIDVFHFHDWHTCMTPLFKKKYERYENSITMLTIHNLNYQGDAPLKLLEDFNLDYDPKTYSLNFLESGINLADEITTVSKTYAEELRYDYYSKNLKDHLVRRRENLYGIVNGLSSKINPKTDLEIKAQYSIDDVFEKKPLNKKYLAEISGFNYSDDMFILGIVSRVNDIKGFDLIIDSMYSILKDEKIHFVMLGVGDKYFMDRLRILESDFKGRVKCFLSFDGTNPSYIYSGADCFLMPSRIEPCGTSQMIALKYGTVPIVRQTGGLNDTIQSFDRRSRSGNGFKFYNIDSRELTSLINFAYSIYRDDKESWECLIKNGMQSDFSFMNCAREYLNLYNIKRKKDR